MHPLIGITGDNAVNHDGQPLTQLTEAYSSAVAQAGGVPLLIPSFLEKTARKALFRRLDGLLFSGGGDIEPRRYHNAYAGRLVSVNPARDELELDLLQMAASSGKPLLGICRGAQLMNVALGGTLYPDLATEPAGPIKHDLGGSERAVLAHTVTTEAGTVLAAILAEHSIDVNSHHHQGLREIPPSLRVAARAPDGLVEAVEIPEHRFALAVQWHPEWLTGQSWTRGLFRAFVAAADSRQ